LIQTAAGLLVIEMEKKMIWRGGEGGRENLPLETQIALPLAAGFPIPTIIASPTRLSN
jgi:hypothetical protein